MWSAGHTLSLPVPEGQQFSPSPARPSLFHPRDCDALHGLRNLLQEQFVIY